MLTGLSSCEFHIVKKGSCAMRRKHNAITDPMEIETILSASRIGRLATVGQDGFPYITPVNFVHLDGNIYFHSAPEGEKLDNIARDPRVCFEVDIPLSYLDMAFDPKGPVCHLHQFYHCVIMRGTASIVLDGQRKVAALNALVAKHEPGARFDPVTEDTPHAGACVVVEVRPTKVTGKRDVAQNKSVEKRAAIAEYLNHRNGPGDREAAEAMGFRFVAEDATEH